MPTFTWSPDDPGVVLENMAVVNGKARLLAQTPDGEYDFPELNPDASYLPIGTIEMRNLTWGNIQDFPWGSEMEYSQPNGSTIRVYFSIDGGATYPGSTTSIDTLYQFFLGSFEMSNQLRLKVEITPSTDGKETPEIGRIFMYGDAEYDVVEDAVRTLSKVIKENANPYIQWYFAHTGGSSFTLLSRFDPTNLGVFDANRMGATQNLVSSYDPGTGLVTLTTSVPAGTELLVRGRLAWASDIQEEGKLRVMVRPEPDYVKSHAPMYVIRHLNSSNYGDGALAGDEEEKRFGVGELAGRLIERPTPVDLVIAVDCVASREQEAYAMARQVRDLFMRDDVEGLWQSLGMGYYFDIVNVVPITDVSIPEDEIHDFQVRAVFGGKEYPSTIREAPLAETIQIDVNNDELVEVEG